MYPNEYQTMALSFLNERVKVNTKLMLLNAVLGLNGEAGECADYLKKAEFQGKDFDSDHMALELGDVLWYVSLAAHSMGYSLSEIMHMNLGKLARRYPDGVFSVERSENRGRDDDYDQH